VRAGADLQMLRTDVGALMLLMRETETVSFTIAAPTGGSPRRFMYPPKTLQHLRAVACAAGALRETRGKRLSGSYAADEDLLRISNIVAIAKSQGQTQYAIRRAALLHADAAMRGGPLHPFQPGTAAPQGITVTASQRGPAPELGFAMRQCQP
jgi:hypothetical protein